MALKILLAFSLSFYIITDLSKCQAYHAALQGDINLIGLKTDTNGDFMPPPEDYAITAVNDAFNIHFEVNSCAGTMNLLSGDGIEMSTMSCTEACCDSDYAQSVIDVLESLESYIEMTDTDIILQGTAGSIWLRSTP